MGIADRIIVIRGLLADTNIKLFNVQYMMKIEELYQLILTFVVERKD